MSATPPDPDESASGATRLAASRPLWAHLVAGMGEVLLTLGVLVLLFVVWQVWWVTREATSASAAVVDELGRSFRSARPPATAPPASAARGTELRHEDLSPGEPFGLVTVPRFGNGPQPVLSGTASAQLDRGIGHQPGSALPGQVGNFATAGHRDTYSHPYNRIDELVRHDAVVVEVQDGWAIYRVEDKRIVEPNEVSVYAPTPDRPGVAPTQAWMTLIACEPHWTAQKRWAVHATLQRWVPRTQAQATAEAAPEVAEALAAPDAPKGLR